MSADFECQIDSFFEAKVDNKAVDIECLFQNRLQKQFETNCAPEIEKTTMFNSVNMPDST